MRARPRIVRLAIVAVCCCAVVAWIDVCPVGPRAAAQEPASETQSSSSDSQSAGAREDSVGSEGQSATEAGQSVTDTGPPDDDVVPPVDDTEPAEVADKIEVVPVNSDGRIAHRLFEIMQATGWFQSPAVEVEDGVVFLSGTAGTEAQRAWAEKTAMRTSDVVAVVNRISLRPRPLFDWQQATGSLRTMLQGFLSELPLYLVALIVILAGYFIACLTARMTRAFYGGQESKLLRQVVASVVWAIVFLIAIFVALKISGLTKLASTLLGGTGLVGLALGFAFRDIAENFLSSLLLSIHSPFCVGDLIEVDGTTGYVRKVTTRATVLATFDGSQVQIPNSTIYKGKITNFTATPLRRQGFKVGIGYQDSASEAQDLIMSVLTEHPAVENEPAPSVVVESLGPSTVNLNCLYWFNQREHSGMKVGSALIRRAKQSLMDAAISLPDEARELVFPAGVPIQMLPPEAIMAPEEAGEEPASESDHSSGEGDLHSEDEDVQQAMGDQSDEDSIV